MSHTYPHSITVSEVFCCATCGAPVALVAQIGGDLTYECQARLCGRTVSVDCPEALQLVEELAVELPVPRLVYEVA